MNFTVVQRFDAAAQDIIEAYRRKATWASFDSLPFVGTPVLEGFEDIEPVRVEASYRVSLELPSAARPFIDPARLTFVEISELAHDGEGRFHIVPHHYSDLIRSAGTTVVTPDGDGRCVRRVEGVVDVSLGWRGMLFEPQVEQAIIGGLEQALLAQAGQVPVT